MSTEMKNDFLKMSKVLLPGKEWAERWRTIDINFWLNFIVVRFVYIVRLLSVSSPRSYALKALYDGQKDHWVRFIVNHLNCAVNSFLLLFNNEQQSHFKLIIQVRVKRNERWKCKYHIINTTNVYYSFPRKTGRKGDGGETIDVQLYHGKTHVPNFITSCFLSCNSRNFPSTLKNCFAFTSIYRRLKPRVYFILFFNFVSSFQKSYCESSHSHTQTHMLENIIK